LNPPPPHPRSPLPPNPSEQDPHALVATRHHTVVTTLRDTTLWSLCYETLHCGHHATRHHCGHHATRHHCGHHAVPSTVITVPEKHVPSVQATSPALNMVAARAGCWHNPQHKTKDKRDSTKQLLPNLTTMTAAHRCDMMTPVRHSRPRYAYVVSVRQLAELVPHVNLSSDTPRPLSTLCHVVTSQPDRSAAYGGKKYS
jgi:hypothetical protein